MAKRPEQNPDQSSLFSLPPATADIRTAQTKAWQELEPQTPVVFGPEGSYISVLRRAIHLQESLRYIGPAHQRSGLRDAAYMRPHDKEIWGRYRGKTAQLLEGAERNENEFVKTVKRNFWKSTGISALVGAGIVEKEEADAMGRSFWRGFESDLGGVGRKKINKRKRYQTKMERQIKYVHKIEKNKSS